MNTAEIVLAVLASPVLVKMIEWLRESLGNRPDPIKDAVFVMLQDRLEYLLEKAIERGSTTTIERKKLRGFLSAYEGLEGDDWIHDLWSMYEELPIKQTSVKVLPP